MQLVHFDTIFVLCHDQTCTVEDRDEVEQLGELKGVQQREVFDRPNAQRAILGD